MRKVFKPVWTVALALALAAFQASLPAAAADPKAEIRKADRIKPEVLAKLLASKSSSAKPALIHIGFRELYTQGHIPASVFAGPGSTEQGLKDLEAHAKGLPRNRALALYCGCCPWADCPNVVPAYKLLRGMGFKKVQVVEMQRNFGADWTGKGFPEAKGKF